MILDVGCGARPRGDINCDRFQNPTLHRTHDAYIGKPQNLVLCDAYFLPFKSGGVETVISSKLIEHLDKPIILVKEMYRVAKRNIIIIAPHRFYIHKRRTKKVHKHYFTRSWFETVFKSLGAQALESQTERAFLSVIPQIIRVEAWKK